MAAPVSSIVDFDVALNVDWTDPLWFLTPSAVGTEPLDDNLTSPLCLPFDLTGFAIEMKVYPNFSFPSEIVELGTSVGTIVIDDAVNGNVHMSVGNVQLSGLPTGSWVHITRATKAITGGTFALELMRGACRFHERRNW